MLSSCRESLGEHPIPNTRKTCLIVSLFAGLYMRVAHVLTGGVQNFPQD